MTLKDIKKITGHSGLKINKIRRRSDMMVLWSAELSIFASGILADGVTKSSEFTIKDDKLCATTERVGQDKSDKTTVYLDGIDFTDYNRLEVSYHAAGWDTYGANWIKYRIGSGNDIQFSNGGNIQGKDGVLTVDVSELTGVQRLTFTLYAEENSSASGASACSSIKISEIRLHNETEQEDNVQAIDDGFGNVTVKGVTATDDGNGNVIIQLNGGNVL